MNPVQLSYSSCNMLKACEQKYYHYKVEKTPRDADQEDDTTALRFGKALHSVLEDTWHDIEKFTVDILNKRCEENEIDVSNKFRVYSAVMEYYRLHDASGLRVHTMEYAIKTDTFIGYVDIILFDDAGNWWIADVKTSSSVQPGLFSRLHRDTQLNLYSFYKDDIGKDLKLDPDKFQGCKYRVVQKTKASPRPNEELYQFEKRVKGKSYEASISYEDMDTNLFVAMHTRYQIKAQRMFDGKVSPTRNYGACFDWFRPCEYFSKCHGCTYTEALAGKFVTASTPDELENAQSIGELL